MKISVPCLSRAMQSASLPGRRSFRAAFWRPISFSCRRRSRSSARSTTQSRSLVASFGEAGEPMVERVADRVLDDPGRLGGGEPVLGLADEFGLADEDREEARRRRSSRRRR